MSINETMLPNNRFFYRGTYLSKSYISDVMMLSCMIGEALFMNSINQDFSFQVNIDGFDPEKFRVANQQAMSFFI